MGVGSWSASEDKVNHKWKVVVITRPRIKKDIIRLQAQCSERFIRKQHGVLYKGILYDQHAILVDYAAKSAWYE